MQIHTGICRKFDTAHTYQHEFTFQAPLSRSTVGLRIKWIGPNCSFFNHNNIEYLVLDEAGSELEPFIGDQATL